MLGLLVSECAYFGVQAESLAVALTDAEVPESQRLRHTLAKLKDLPLPQMPKGRAEEDEKEEEAQAEEGKGKERCVFISRDNSRRLVASPLIISVTKLSMALHKQDGLGC